MHMKRGEKVGEKDHGVKRSSIFRYHCELCGKTKDLIGWVKPVCECQYNQKNGLTCLVCEKPLVGKQTKFCCNEHRHKYNRDQKEDYKTDGPANWTGYPDKNRSYNLKNLNKGFTQYLEGA